MSETNSVKEKKDRLIAGLKEMARLIGAKSTGETTLIDGVSVSLGMGLEKEAGDLYQHALHLGEGIFFITVMGEFKNGKSTVINAMVGEELLPAKVTPATAVITMLVCGPEREARVYYKTDPKNPSGPWDPTQPVRLSYEDFKEEFELTDADQETYDGKGSYTRFDNILYAEVTTSCLIAQGGVKIVDSPGLGEAEARTATTMGFLAQSQAVVMTLNANKQLSQEERKFIETYLKEAIPNRAFFLISRFDQINRKGKEEVRSFVKTYLAPFFSDTSGDFDEDLYNRRVFFLSGQEALEARLEAPVDQERLAGSGVPAFERELGRYLSSPEKWTAATDAIFQQVGVVFGKSSQALAVGKASAGQTLEVLEARRASLAGELRRKVEEKEEIEGLIDTTSRLVQAKLYSSLQSHITELEATWPQRGLDALPALRQLTILEIGPMLLDKNKQTAFGRRVSEQAQQYIKASLAEWGAKMGPAVVTADLARMQKEVEVRTKNLLAGLVKIMDIFVQRESTEVDQENVDSMVKLLMQELRGLAPSAGNVDVSGPIIKRLIQHTLVNLGILIFLGGFSILLVIWQVINLKGTINQIKVDVVTKIGQEMFPLLRQRIGEYEKNFKGEIAARFMQIGAQIGTELQKEIDQVQRQMDAFIEEKRQEGYDAQAEVARLEALQGEMGRHATILAGAIGRPVPADWLRTAPIKKALETTEALELIAA